VTNSGSAVFDKFACISKDTPIEFHWPLVSLTHQEPDDLAKVLRRLTYFGRAESWCEATASTGLPPEVKPGDTHWCCCCIEDGCIPDGREHVDYNLERKLAPLLPLDRGLRAQMVELLPSLDLWEAGKKPKEGRPAGKWRKATREETKANLSSEPPSHSLLRCLLRTSGDDMKDGLERPIGTRWVHYAVPRAIYELPPRSRPKRGTRSEPSVNLITFALNTATVNRPVLPQVTDTLLVADKLRAAALAWHGHVAGEYPDDQRHPRNLCGREVDGSRVEGNDHAFFWPTDEDNDGLIDHVSVFCRPGLLPVEVEALRRLLRLKQRGGRPDLLVTPTFLGNACSFKPWKGTTSRFVSATPYFCPVHLDHGRKRGGAVRSVVAEIRRSLLLTGIIESERDLVRADELFFPFAQTESRMDEPAIASGMPDNPRYIGASLKAPDDAPQPGSAVGFRVENGNRFIRALEFCRRRRQHVVEGPGRLFVLEFAAPVSARPFSIGAQAHFGLGLFVPVVDSTDRTLE
jgi:CRISPR-associated protein Csb2